MMAMHLPLFVHLHVIVQGTHVIVLQAPCRAVDLHDPGALDRP